MRGLFLALSVVTIINNCGLADLRNDFLREDTIPEDVQSQAKNMLRNPTDPYLDPTLWQDTKSIELLLVDYWNSGIIRLFTPIPERVQAMKVVLSLNKNTIHIRFTDGRYRKKMIGIEDGEPYTYDSKNGKVFNKDSEIQIYSESLRFYILFPFQVYRYNRLAYLGEMSLDNADYYEIFATEGDWEISDQFDQYRIYLRKDSGKIEYAQFTYRNVFPFYKGILQYEDYTQQYGRLFPMKIGIKNDFLDETFIHQLQIGSVKFLDKEPDWEY